MSVPSEMVRRLIDDGSNDRSLGSIHVCFLSQINSNKNDVILNAPCGTGRYSKILSDLGARVYGCDISEKMLEVARTKIPGALFNVVDLNGELPYEDQKFSKIVCSLAIRHLENLQGFLDEGHRLLVPGGLLVFSAIHPEMDWSSYERSSPPPIELNAEGVIFPYSIEDLKEAVVKSGFIDQEIFELYADDKVKPFLTEKSFQLQNGKKYVLIFRLSKS